MFYYALGQVMRRRWRFFHSSPTFETSHHLCALTPSKSIWLMVWRNPVGLVQTNPTTSFCRFFVRLNGQSVDANCFWGQTLKTLTLISMEIKKIGMESNLPAGKHFSPTWADNCFQCLASTVIVVNVMFKCASSPTKSGANHFVDRFFQLPTILLTLLTPLILFGFELVHWGRRNISAPNQINR